MFKKVLIGASLVSVSLVTQAAFVNPDNCNYFSGPYIGITGLYQSDNDKFTLNNAAVVDKQRRNVDIYAGHDAWGGGLFAGYGQVLTNSRTFVGAELYGNAVAGKQKLASVGDDYYIAMKTPYTWGAMAKVGYLVTPQSLVYVGLGAENTRFKLIDGTTNADKDLIDTHKWAIVPSVGVNVALNCNWQIGAKFSYANYRSIDIIDENNVNRGSINPRRATFGLNVTYHFV